jgi:multidrug efflux system outer membrane protein
VIFLSVAAYAVGPDYKKPDTATPAHWQAPAPWQNASPLDSIPRGSWWKLFGDPELDQYEERAMVNSQTLKAAVARLAEARASARVTAADLYPEVNLGPTVSHERLSGNRPVNGAPVNPAVMHQSDFVIPFTLNYEIDLFGRVRRSVEAANASLQASAADLENVRLMLSSELAADYFQMRELDAEIAVVNKGIEFQQKGLVLVERRHTGGVVSGLDVAQQQAILDSSYTQLRQLQQQRAQYEHAVAMLQGLPAPDFHAPVRPLDVAPPPVPLSLPSELLQRRPDIATAERRVASANAQIGVARAALYPSISLAGTEAGFESRHLASILNAPSFFWSIGLAAIEPIIAGGRYHARLDYARDVYAEEVANYRESALVAFQQVEDALSGLNALAAASESQQRAVADSSRFLDIANIRYTGGLVTYLDVITAQVQTLANERLATQLMGQRLITSVYLVKALGGGWDSSSIASLGVKPSLKQAVQQ